MHMLLDVIRNGQFYVISADVQFIIRKKTFKTKIKWWVPILCRFNMYVFIGWLPVWGDRRWQLTGLTYGGFPIYGCNGGGLRLGQLTGPAAAGTACLFSICCVKTMPFQSMLDTQLISYTVNMQHRTSIHILDQ